MSRELVYKPNSYSHSTITKSAVSQVDTPLNIVQLQRTVGNQAVQRMLRSEQIKLHKNQAQVQRLFGFGKKKPKEQQRLLDAPDQSDDLDIDIAPIDDIENEETQTKISKLGVLREKLGLYAVIHQKYKQYAAYIGKGAWNKCLSIWDYVNKALNILQFLDPSGITAIIGKVSALVKTIATYATEVYRLIKDQDLVEQLTPLLPKTLSFSMVFGIGQEVWDFKGAVEDAIGAITDAV